MSSRSQAILKEIKALPPAEQREVCSHVMEWFQASQRVAAEADPVQSARGMFAGQRLNQALMKQRLEERGRASNRHDDVQN